MAQAILKSREMVATLDREARKGAGEAGVATSTSGNPRGVVEARRSEPKLPRQTVRHACRSHSTAHEPDRFRSS